MYKNVKNLKHQSWINDRLKELSNAVGGCTISNVLRCYRSTINPTNNAVSVWYDVLGKSSIVVAVRGRTISISNIETGEAVCTKCHKDDTFNIAIGLAICWAKYCNMDIPTFDITVGDIKAGGKFKFSSGRVYYKVGVNPFNTEYSVIVNKDTGGMRNALNTHPCTEVS